MLDLSQKRIIMPFVVVYKNALKNYVDVLNGIKQTEINQVEGGIIQPWKQWYEFGETVRVEPDLQSKSFKDKNPEEYQSQFNVFSSLNSIIYEGYDDYISQWTKPEVINSFGGSHPHHWQKVFGDIVFDWNYKNIKSFDEDFSGYEKPINIAGDSGWISSSIDVAKHRAHTGREYAIHYHLDSSGDLNPGPKAILTATVYLNDDYEGGEISFLNEFDEVIINYKPSAGDLVIFPSSKPFFHAAMPTFGNINKYFARHFLTWKYTGSEEWHQGVEKYGEAAWAEIRSQVRKAEEAMGFYNKDVYYPDQRSNGDLKYNGMPFFAKEVIDLEA